MNKLNTIYKVHIVSDTNTLKEVIVFYGRSIHDIGKDTLKEKFASEPSNDLFLDKYTGKPIFSEDEIEFIKKNNANVTFSEHQIHLDDSILSVKLKILIEMKKEVGTEEMFLYCLKNETITPVEFYKILTQNQRVLLTKKRLENAIQNFKSENIFSSYTINLEDNNKDNNYYSYEDVIKLDIFNKPITTVNMLGQKLFIIDNHYPFSYNPYDLKNYDKILFSATSNAITTMNNNLILDNGEFINNTIYLTFAEDVLSHKFEDSQINEQFLINVYFPLLVNHQVSSSLQLNEQRKKIFKETEKLISEATKNTFHKEDMLYDIHNSVSTLESSLFKYEAKGILEMKFAIQQRFTMNVPLDVLFKVIPTNSIVPLTKLNPSSYRENNYKLYGETKSRDNRIVPLLEKSKIMYLINNMGKTKGVSLYFMTEHDKDKDTDNDIQSNLFCDFLENGDTVVHVKYSRPVSLSDVTNITLKYIAPVIQHISDFFLQSGYQFQNFTSLYESNIEIIQIQYGCDITIENQAPDFELHKVQNCISPVFIVKSNNIKAKNGIGMRYRKVSNFNEMTSKEAFIIEQIKKREGYQGDALVESLMQAHSLNEDEARELIARVAAEMTIDTGGIGTKTSRIRSNPGFSAKITDVTKKSLRLERKVRVEINGIDNIYYIQPISIYVDSLLHLVFNHSQVESFHPDVNDICSLSQNENIQKKDDVISAAEQNIVTKDEIVITDEGVSVFSDAEPISYEEYQDVTAPVVSALDLIYGKDPDGSDDEYESDDYAGYDDDIDYENNQTGGNDNDIIGMRLAKPNPFVLHMRQADPDLFPVKSDGKYVSYSRNCDSAIGRQPVLMTMDEYEKEVQKEKDGIIERYEDENGEDSFWDLSEEEQDEVIDEATQLDHRYVVTYGTSSNKKHVYACPRYWCLKTNSYIHPDEMRVKKNADGNPMKDADGKVIMEHPTCGGVIPRGQQTVQDDGNFVFEFTGKKREHSKTGKYAPQYPGFLPRDKHPQKKCMPCCFNFSDKLRYSEDQIAKRKDCVRDIQETDNEETARDISSSLQEKSGVNNENASGVLLRILDQSAHPLPKERWGFLPIEIQHFVKDYSNKYLEETHDMQIKNNALVLLRHGIDMKQNSQSFLAAINDIMFYESVNDKKTLDDFKKYLLSKLTLERFVRYQNGNLIREFYNDTNIEKQSVSRHIDSPLYNEQNHEAFVKLVRSYDNFIAFILLDTTFIDHTYLWDFVCDKDVHESHPNGANLVILNIPEDDGTTKVDVVCPSNHYSSTMFDDEKPTMILIKRDTVYEPLYSLKKTPETIKFQKYFSREESDVPSVTNNMTHPMIIDMLEKIINPIYQTKCSPLKSLRSEYNFREAILLGKLYKMLLKKKDVVVKIEKQVFNYSYKTVALFVKIGNLAGLIPCYPSASLYSDTIKNTFIDDDQLYSDYNTTIEFINKVIHHFGESIPIQPSFKIVEDEVVVGILTISNQMILLSQPIPLSSTNDDIPVIRHKGYVVDRETSNKTSIDSYISKNRIIDNERKEYVNKIKLETNFFNAFRNTVRLLLNDFTYLNIRSDIEKEIDNKFTLYPSKLENISDKIKQLISNTVRFSEELDVSRLSNISLCINSTSEKCNDNNPVCVYSEENEKCVLVIPRYNIVSPEINNEIVYITKIADQLIRYTRIRKFMLDTSQFLSIGDVNFELSHNETVVPQSILKTTYFNNLRSHKGSTYASTNSYDETNPIHMTMKYKTDFDYSDIEKDLVKNLDNIETNKSQRPKQKILIKATRKVNMPSQKLQEDDENEKDLNLEPPYEVQTSEEK
jgi:hypothetical protein